jgi:hypothetical protein
VNILVFHKSFGEDTFCRTINKLKRPMLDNRWQSLHRWQVMQAGTCVTTSHSLDFTVMKCTAYCSYRRDISVPDTGNPIKLCYTRAVWRSTRGKPPKKFKK